MRLQDAIHTRIFEEGDLLQYNLHGTTEMRYGVVEIACKYIQGRDDDELVRMWRQSILPFGEMKESSYLRNVHRNFGQIAFKDFMHENPEYFI